MRKDREGGKHYFARERGKLSDSLSLFFFLSLRSKSISLDMIRRIEEAFVENLDTVDVISFFIFFFIFFIDFSKKWMDDETAGLAVEKMEKITNKIGFTDKWRSYGKVFFSLFSFTSSFLCFFYFFFLFWLIFFLSQSVESYRRRFLWNFFKLCRNDV